MLEEWLVGGDLCLVLVGPAAGQDLVNQVIMHRQLKQFLVSLRVTLLSLLLMPGTIKTWPGWCCWGSGMLHPCSLPHCCHASIPPAATARVPCMLPGVNPVTKSSHPPKPGAVWLSAHGHRLCLCQWNALMQCFQSEYLHTVLPCAIHMAQICL